MAWAPTSATACGAPSPAPERIAALIIVISGPGGAGKGTVVRRLLERDPTLWLSRSWTTRPRRPGEDEDAYNFVDEATFRARIADGGFLEWAEFLDRLYGTPTPEAPDGADVVLEIEVQGAGQVRAAHPEAVLVLVTTPTPAVQEARLRGRGDPDDSVAARLAVAAEEVAVATALGAVTVVNDDVERAVEEIEAIIAARRAAGA